MSRTYSKSYILVFRFLLIGSWIAAASMLRAQVPEIENEIRAHRSEKELLIQGRYMLLDSLKAGNIEKVVEVRNYLMTLSDDLLAFLPSEYFLILYLTGEFELRQSINDEVYFGMQNEFLQLYLTYLLKETYSGFDSPDQQEVNEEASHYLERYPNSEWNSYIREYIRIVYGPSSWFGGLAIGGGFMSLTQDLKRRYGIQVVSISKSMEDINNMGWPWTFCLELLRIRSNRLTPFRTGTKLFGGPERQRLFSGAL